MAAPAVPEVQFAANWDANTLAPDGGSHNDGESTLMHGLYAAIGPTACNREIKWGIPGEVQNVSLNGARIQRRSPLGQALPDWQGRSPSGRVRVFLDGDLAVRDLPISQGLSTHLAAFAETVESRGIDAALESLVAGSFAAIVLDGTGRALLLRDPYGSLPVYEAQAGSDWLVSTNPVSLARAEGVDTTPDRIALASWALVGYTIGTHYMIRGIRTVRTGVQLVRTADGSVTSTPLPFDVFSQVPLPAGGPSIAEIADGFKIACERLASAPLPTAHLQSGGMDSRLILAAWPEGQPIQCYGYGDPDSGEVAIAREVARLRGAPYHHVQPDGNQVADLLDYIYEANGLMVYPARWFVAEKMAADGHLRFLDGFAGGFVLGGHFFSPPRKLSSLPCKLRARYRDADIDAIGLEQIACDVYAEICELPSLSALSDYVNADFIAELASTREQIVAEIHDELLRLRPQNNSVALLVQNFTIANRSAHAILQQGVMSRQKLSVGYPYTSDYDFLRLALSIPPSRSAYRRLQIEVFRKHFPRYAELPYAASMLPLRRSPSAHQISGMLIRRGIHIPGLTGRLTRSPNNWKRWLSESSALREKLGEAFQTGGIAGARLQDRLNELAIGTANGNGKLLHVASIGRWLGMSQQRP